MKLHQIKYSGYGEILFRDFSCVCSEEKYVHIHELIDDMRSTLNFYFSPLIMNEGTKVDVSTLRLCPPGIPKDTTLYHAMITADGNCLPYSGSVIASGNEDGEEMRVRLIIESCIHK
ncbi:hypothetical protein ACJMK2_042754 [Sinanodonta woodiana]|uniref:Uncharacterized protein n=1 Tax=Sinanodonta woodiana TaxID=1069815 RepID=A0ABD3VUT3_SINWO